MLSCFPLVMDLKYFFKFYNNSDEDVYVIIDMEPQDEIINVGSEVDWCGANSFQSIINKKPWYEVVKDSMYLYVIDESKIELSTMLGFTQENAEILTSDMILSRFTIYHQDLYSQYTVSYPWKKTY